MAKKLSKKEQQIIGELQKISYADDYSPNKKVLIIDNYRNNNTQAIQNVYSAVKESGYSPVVMRHSEAKKILKGGKDFAEGYHATIPAGSDKTWKKTDKTDEQGRAYLDNNDPVHRHLAEHNIPVYAICGGAQAIAKELGYQVKDSGAFNRKNGKDGHAYNHKYAIEPNNTIDARVETFRHNGDKYVKSISAGNKFLAQYHPEKTLIGRQELKKFLNRYAKSTRDNYEKQYSKAA